LTGANEQWLPAFSIDSEQKILSISFETSEQVPSFVFETFTMKLAEAKQQFISSWGAFGTHWGINRTMAQIHALLMISADPLSQDDLMEQLNVSRGNANMNIRELIDWGLVDRVIIPGERKEYFTAEKDIWKVATQIVKERKKRELNPMLKLLDQLGEVEGDKKDKNVKQFTDTINGIKRFGLQADKMLDVLVKADENWFVGSLMKLFK
jgi:DNA-binding transcriptional regulator GbsR (MarR family)